MNLQQRIGTWQDATFGRSQNISGLQAHMAKEMQELFEAKTPAAIEEECADLLILLMGRAHRAGFDLLEAAERKLEINKTRVWGKPDAQGVIEHLR